MPHSIRLSHRPSDSSRLSFKHKCRIAAVALMILPILAWPVLAMLVIGGCTGNLHAGISCPPIAGIHLHTLATDLLLFSAKGLAYSVPLGAALLLACRLVSGTSRA